MGGGAAAPMHEDELTLTTLLRIVQRRWMIALPIFVLSVGIAVWQFQQQTPLYEASATIRVDKAKETVPGFAPNAASGFGAPGELSTEMQVMQSRTVAREVAAATSYAVHIDQPKLPRSAVLQSVQTGAPASPGLYQLVSVGGNRVTLTGPGGATRTDTVGAWFEMNGLRLQVAPAMRAQSEPVTLRVLTSEQATDSVRRVLRVTQPVRTAQVLQITARDPDPTLAAMVANAAAEEFTISQTRRRQTGGRSMVTFIRTQLDTLERQLATAEVQLRDWRSAQKVVVPGAEAGGAVARRGEYEQLLIERRLELENIEELLGGSLPTSNTEPSDVLVRGFRSVLSSPVMRGGGGGSAILSTLIELEAKRAELRLRRKPEDPEVLVLDRTIADYERQGQLFVSSYVRALRTEIAGTDRALSRVGTQLQRFPGQELELSTLQRNAEVLAALQATLRTRLKEAEITNASGEATSELLDLAMPPGGPVAPVLVRFVGIGVSAGLVLALLGALLRDRLDRTIHSREDLERATGASLLALVPSFGGKKALMPRRTRAIPQRPTVAGTALTTEANLSGKATVALAHPERVLAVHAPRHVAAEAYRMLRTNLRFSPSDQPRQVLIITSPTPGDGKSTTALNYTATVALQGKRVLLVDGDMRRGTQHKALGVPRGPGLSDLLSSGATAADILKVVHTVQLADRVTMDVIAAGDAPPNPAELLGGPALAALVAWGRANYDVVVLDTPPINLFADGLLLAASGDAVLLVGRAGKSRREELTMAAEQVRAVHVPLAGVVLNDYVVNRDSRYGGAYYQYDRSYYKYYAEYAKDEAAA